MEKAVKAAKNCKIEACKGVYRAKGYCTKHYRKWRQGEYGKKRYKMCGEEACRKPMVKKGRCQDHYTTWSQSKNKKGVVEEEATEKTVVSS